MNAVTGSCTANTAGSYLPRYKLTAATSFGCVSVSGAVVRRAEYSRAAVVDDLTCVKFSCSDAPRR